MNVIVTGLIMEIGLDGSAPIGPILVSPAAVGDPHKLAIKAIYNDVVVQDSNTELVFPNSRLLSS